MVSHALRGNGDERVTVRERQVSADALLVGIQVRHGFADAQRVLGNGRAASAALGATGRGAFDDVWQAMSYYQTRHSRRPVFWL